MLFFEDSFHTIRYDFVNKRKGREGKGRKEIGGLFCGREFVGRASLRRSIITIDDEKFRQCCFTSYKIDRDDDVLFSLERTVGQEMIHINTVLYKSSAQ